MKLLLFISIIIIVFLILLLLLFINKRNVFFDKNTDFKIENRVNDIKKEKKNDQYEYETVAWLRVQGTNIDYPIIIDKSGKYDNPVERKAYGWLNSQDGTYKNNLTIDGHNIFNLGVPKKQSDTFFRFEELMAYAYYDFAKENQFIQLTMDNKNYLYQVFAVTLIYDLDLDLLPAVNVDKTVQQEQIDFFKKHSIYDYDIEVKSSDNILNVATCTRILGKTNPTNFVLSAKLVKNKNISLNSMKKTKKYDKIELTLKGSENDESKKI